MTNTLVAQGTDTVPAAVRLFEGRTSPQRRERTAERGREDRHSTWSQWLREMAESAD